MDNYSEALRNYEYVSFADKMQEDVFEKSMMNEAVKIP